MEGRAVRLMERLAVLIVSCAALLCAIPEAQAARRCQLHVFVDLNGIAHLGSDDYDMREEADTNEPSFDAFQERLTNLHARSPGCVVVINADRDTLYGNIGRVILAIQLAGYRGENQVRFLPI